MSDYYDLLGVAPDAEREEIKNAYRERLDGVEQAKKAELNRAWNVLSDPIQRERYDERLAAKSADIDLTGEDPDDMSGPVPAKTATGARSAKERPARREPLTSTVVLPAGMHLAEKKPRGMATAFDLSIVAVIAFVGLFVISPMVLSNQYPNKVDQINALTKCIDYNRDSSKSPKQPADCTERSSSKKTRDATASKLEKQQSNLQSDMAPTQFLVLGGVLLLCLVYLVPMTVLTGQTFGKRLRKVWLVRTNGARVGWAAAMAHYLPPLAIALVLPQIGVLIAIGMVFWSLRDRNGQGIHDKLAKTLVVDSPPEGLAPAT